MRNMTPVQFGLLVEQFTFNYLERKYGKPIQRYVRFRGKGGSVEFDGVIQGQDTDLIFEIKTSRRGVLPLAFLQDVVSRYVHKIRTYKEITPEGVLH
jgi:predicted AAA+ superfamily ATPase